MPSKRKSFMVPLDGHVTRAPSDHGYHLQMSISVYANGSVVENAWLREPFSKQRYGRGVGCWGWPRRLE